MSTRDITKTFKRFYGVDVSPDLISRVTDGVLEELAAWQARPLNQVYPIIYIDGLVIKVCTNGHVINRCAYLVTGVDIDGHKHVLGVWLGDGGEGAKFWLSILSEIKNRGVADGIFVCCDGLKGLPDAIEATWPKASVQTLLSISSGHRCATAPGRTKGDHQGPTADLHRSWCRGGGGGNGQLRDRVRRALPGHREAVAERLGAIHPLPGLPTGHCQDRLHDGPRRYLEPAWGCLGRS